MVILIMVDTTIALCAASTVTRVAVFNKACTEFYCDPKLMWMKQKGYMFPLSLVILKSTEGRFSAVLFSQKHLASSSFPRVNFDVVRPTLGSDII